MKITIISIGKKAGGSKRYVPQKNSAAYAILITLHRYALLGDIFFIIFAVHQMKVFSISWQTMIYNHRN